MVSDLYRKYRPTRFADVVGQARAVEILEGKLGEDLPHCIMLVGPTGTGKTTIAGILAAGLGCSETFVFTQDCAKFRGIDTVDDLREAIRFRNLDGSPKVCILEEVVQLPKLTQQAMLTLLETVPEHAYFILCTSDTSGLLPTFMGRCFQIELSRLSPSEVKEVLVRILREEGKTKYVSSTVMEAIARCSEGNARKAVQILEAILSVEGEERQLKVAGMTRADEQEKGEFLARALFSLTWTDVQKSLQSIEDKDVEGVRRQTLAYARKVLLGGGGRAQTAHQVIEALKYSLSESGAAGLASACYSLMPVMNLPGRRTMRD